MKRSNPVLKLARFCEGAIHNVTDGMDDEIKADRGWRRVDGNKTLRLDYDNLTPGSLVLDLGGYEGQWTSDIYAKYNCDVHVFEPVEKFYKKIKIRFKRNKKIRVFNYGLANTTKNAFMSIREDASSFCTGDDTFGDHALGFLMEAAPFIDRLGDIQLMKINIEGGEYDLLDHLIETGAISKIDSIQVQFHDFVPDAKARSDKIREDLSKTHVLTWQYPAFENWKRKLP